MRLQDDWFKVYEKGGSNLNIDNCADLFEQIQQLSRIRILPPFFEEKKNKMIKIYQLQDYN